MSLKSAAAASAIVPQVMREGAFLFVARVHGLDERFPDNGLEQQAQVALGRITLALAGCGATLRHVVRARYLLPHGSDLGEFTRCAGRLGAALGDARPIATLVAAGVLPPHARIEIEVRARLGA